MTDEDNHRLKKLGDRLHEVCKDYQLHEIFTCLEHQWAFWMTYTCSECRKAIAKRLAHRATRVILKRADEFARSGGFDAHCDHAKQLH